jgi:hypothetical protein
MPPGGIMSDDVQFHAACRISGRLNSMTTATCNTPAYLFDVQAKTACVDTSKDMSRLISQHQAVPNVYQPPPARKVAPFSISTLYFPNAKRRHYWENRGNNSKAR